MVKRWVVINRLHIPDRFTQYLSQHKFHWLIYWHYCFAVFIFLLFLFLHFQSYRMVLNWVLITVKRDLVKKLTEGVFCSFFFSIEMWMRSKGKRFNWKCNEIYVCWFTKKGMQPILRNEKKERFKLSLLSTSFMSNSFMMSKSITKCY